VREMASSHLARDMRQRASGQKAPRGRRGVASGSTQGSSSGSVASGSGGAEECSSSCSMLVSSSSATCDDVWFSEVAERFSNPFYVMFSPAASPSCNTLVQDTIGTI
jgi:hypothetical protein